MMTAQEYYALKMLILVALNSKECKNNAVMYDRASGFKMPMSEVIGIAVEYLVNFDSGVIENPSDLFI